MFVINGYLGQGFGVNSHHHRWHSQPLLMTAWQQGAGKRR
jgi:hypothetical protein